MKLFKLSQSNEFFLHILSFVTIFFLPFTIWDVTFRVLTIQAVKTGVDTIWVPIKIFVTFWFCHNLSFGKILVSLQFEFCCNLSFVLTYLLCWCFCSSQFLLHNNLYLIKLRVLITTKRYDPISQDFFALWAKKGWTTLPLFTIGFVFHPHLFLFPILWFIPFCAFYHLLYLIQFVFCHNFCFITICVIF